MHFEQVHNNKAVLLLQCISGSRSYGLDTPESDTDIKGVFYLPKNEFYGLGHTEQVANASNDIVYYELKRYVDLLIKNNPNILELLNTPKDCILYRHPVLACLNPEIFLSKLCLQTFAGYAQIQVKKAGGLNKKIFNPIARERKNLLEFCYVISGYSSIPLAPWLEAKGLRQEDCGLVRITHARDIYALFHQSQINSSKLAGIFSGDAANDVRLSSIPESVQPLSIISFNKDGYSTYCKDYKEYWEWVEKRNDVRYENTLEHGKNYDAKNMMHTFRLLNMAGEIASEKRINVRRPDRDFLFKIRKGEYTYEQLMAMIDEKMAAIKDQFEKSDLPDVPDEHVANDLLIQIRSSLMDGHRA